MSAQDAIRRAQAWLAALPPPDEWAYTDEEIAAETRLAALGPASVDLAWRVQVDHVEAGCDLEPDNCLTCTALAEWCVAAGEPREPH